MEIKAPLSAGALFDRIAALDIKFEFLESDSRNGGLSEFHRRQLANVKKEREILLDIAEYLWKPGLNELFNQLRQANEDIRIIATSIEAESKKWIPNPWKTNNLARAMCKTIRRQEEIRREIDELLGSEIVEEIVR